MSGGIDTTGGGPPKTGRAAGAGGDEAAEDWVSEAAESPGGGFERRESADGQKY